MQCRHHGTAAVCGLVTAFVALSAFVTLGHNPRSAQPNHGAAQHELLHTGDARAHVLGSAAFGNSSPGAVTVSEYLSSGSTINAFVFAGRRRYMRVLWPYLLRDRRSASGGTEVLSQVIFAANTDDADDLAFLSDLEASYPDYVRVIHPPRVVHQGTNNGDYCSIYGGVTELLGDQDNGAGRQLMLKLDDDIVYIAPGALRALAAAKLRHPELLFVSANVVNHPLLAHVHQRLMLLSQTEVAAMVEAETASGNADVSTLPEKWIFGYATFDHDNWQSPPHALLQHMMLLHRLRTLGENGTVAAYGGFRAWDFDAQGYGTARWSINAFAYWPDTDLELMDLDACGRLDDEEYLTRVLPEVVGRHSIATGDALVAHFAYYPQRKGLEEDTHLLARYQALADAVAAQTSP